MALAFGLMRSPGLHLALTLDHVQASDAALFCVLFVSGIMPSLCTNPAMVNAGTPREVPNDSDCAVRTIAWEFGKSLKPDRGGFKTLYDALQLQSCGVPPPADQDIWRPPDSANSLNHRLSVHTLYVSAEGSHRRSRPIGGADVFPSLAAAVEHSRGLKRRPVHILLHEGVHAVQSAIELGPADSFLRISNVPGETAVLSAGTPLLPRWRASAACVGCFEAALPDVPAIAGLRRNGVREIRARWPNFDEELDSVDEHGRYHVHNGRDGWVTSPTEWLMNGTDMNGVPGPWPPRGQATTSIVSAADWPDVDWPAHIYVPTANGSKAATSDQWTGEGDWGQFWIGEGGTCADREPPVGYWCAPKAPRSISPANHPGGIFAEPVRGFRYANPAGAVIHSWMPYHWYTYMFEVRGSRLIPGTARAARSYPGTNAIWGRCTAPTTCASGIDFIGNFSTEAECTGSVQSTTHVSYTWFEPTFSQPAYARRCYGISGVVVAPRPQQGVISGTLAYAGDSVLDFGRGGFQGGEGISPDGSNLNLSNWYIENVMEELDSPREWFFNQSTRTLYYKPNASAPGTTDPATGLPTGDFVMTGTKVLINATGSQADPVVNVSIGGLVLRDTAYTYMDPHGLPSGGDWALQKQGAITLVGTEGTVIENNLFTRLDGNAIFIGGYHRGLQISDNEFEFIGDSAMASWGDTGFRLNANGSKTMNYPVGPDGRGGNQNRGAKITGNIARELGLWQKQSSMWFQAVTTGTEFKGNVFMNGPRAAYNDNDGFGGGDELSYNLLINSCRESGDHGPWNSWNRVPYITEERYGPGKPSIVPKDVLIHHNFFLGTYNAICAIDTDDGSSYIQVFDNVLGYATAGLKSDFGGHDEVYRGNLLLFVGDCIMDGMNADSMPGHSIGYNDGFVNNTCIYTNSYQSDCFTNPKQPATGRGWDVHDNKVFSKTGQTMVCNREVPLSEWVNQGHDHGSTSSQWPTNAEIAAMAAAVLGQPNEIK